jgi:D-amino-acid oxidase
LPDMAEAERILKETCKLAPDLSPTGNWRDIEIISHNAGLRPARKSGIRLELEKREIGGGKHALLVPGEKKADGAGAAGKKEEVAVVHAYGLGSGG